MGTFTKGVQLVSTVTVGASGGSNTALVNLVRSNTPFRNLSLTVIPLEDPSPYSVDVYHDGELEEGHSFTATTDRVVCHMYFKGFMFPANTGTNAIPKFVYPDKKDFAGVGMLMRITNLSGNTRVFQVYSVFEQFGDNAAFGVIYQE